MAQEIGVAYVSLLPSGKGFSKGVQTEAESAFKGAEKSSDGFFSGVTRWAKRGALAVAGIVTTVGALAVGGGISRALNIEDATAKLKGLGHDTKAVEAIMQDALASVKGTAFGLDAAATTAASAVAAGIKPGQELERYLRLTADAATIAGTSMGEMGDIINQVTSKGYAGMENLNRLTERGIPIMQWLQKEYGVTADELQKMVSRGEIDAATFRKAIEDNIGGAALESGNTTRGAFANMRASLSRLGLAFVGDGLSGAKTFFNEITVILDGLEERVGPWVQRIQDKLGGLVQLDGFGERFLAGLDSFIANFDSTPFGILLTTLEPLVPVLRELGSKIGPVLAATFEQVAEALEPVIPMLSEALVDAVEQLAPPLTDLLVALLPLIPPLVQLAVDILPVLTEALAILVPVLVPLIQGLAELTAFVVNLLLFLNGNTTMDEWGRQIEGTQGPIIDMARGINEWLAPALNFLMGLVSQVASTWNAAWSRVTSFFSSAASNISGTATRIWSTLTSVFSSGVSRVVSIFTGLPRHIQNLFAGAGSWLVSSGRALLQGFIDGINSMIRNVGDAIGGVLSWAQGFFPHSPALRGPFSGQGWAAVFDGGQSLMEQFAVGAESFRPEFSFSSLTNLLGSAHGGQSSEVSLAGATFTMLVDGRPMRGMIQEQIVQQSALSRVALENGSRR
ncbi:tape measure protein [Microbacterium sp. KSW4-4]|uniref:tape measure protein n=1 Tax=Microbacterium sp. KSW4-4 TaxID=2851651 RepID=UPI001FFCF47E|nr:tape measure protein [Microbacterium sp. KSW4-4]MCK2034486.1 tape measure protein [Microbacterium sp. KSW4-4]